MYYSYLFISAYVKSISQYSDIKDMVVKSDIKDMVVKSDLEPFATKADIKNMATKDDLKAFATKEDFNHLDTKIDRIDVNVDRLGRKLDSHKMANVKHQLEMRSSLDDLNTKLMRIREGLAQTAQD